MLSTPWGRAQQQYQITEGVWEVSTAGHGGILVDKEVAPKLLSEAARKRGWDYGGNFLAYEEDCDFALFVFEQPTLYAGICKARGCACTNKESCHTPEEMKEIARGSLSRWNPDYLTEVGEHAEEEK